MNYSLRYLKVIAIDTPTAILESLDISKLETHEKYPLFLATLKHFFNLGQPKKVSAMNKLPRHPGMSKTPITPHFLDSRDWVSAFSYVLDPDVFLSLCHYVHIQDQLVCSFLYKTLITQMATESVCPKKQLTEYVPIRVPITSTTSTQTTVVTFFHGSPNIPYSEGYAKALRDAIKKASRDTGQMMHEINIDKISDLFNPTLSGDKSNFDIAKRILSPVFSPSKPLDFTLSDCWLKSISTLCKHYALQCQKHSTLPPLSKLKTGLTQGALLGHRVHFKGNIHSYPFNHTWSAATSLVTDWDTDLSALNFQSFQVDDWSAITLGSIDMAIQVHRQLIQTPKNSLVVAGATHDYQLNLFLQNPASLYHTLTHIFDQYNTLMQRLNSVTQSSILLPFKYQIPELPPTTSQELITWVDDVKFIRADRLSQIISQEGCLH